jgi:hypothetical protein
MGAYMIATTSEPGTRKRFVETEALILAYVKTTGDQSMLEAASFYTGGCVRCTAVNRAMIRWRAENRYSQESWSAIDHRAEIEAELIDAVVAGFEPDMLGCRRCAPIFANRCSGGYSAPPPAGL